MIDPYRPPEAPCKQEPDLIYRLGPLELAGVAAVLLILAVLLYPNLMKALEG